MEQAVDSHVNQARRLLMSAKASKSKHPSVGATTTIGPLMEPNGATDPLTRALEEKLSHAATSADFDFHKGVNEVLADVGMTSDDSGGKLSFYGADPIIPSPFRFGTMAALGMAARSVALAALWRQATGEGQDIALD